MYSFSNHCHSYHQLYNYFRSKDAVLKAVPGEVLEDFGASKKSWFGEDVSTQARLRRLHRGLGQYRLAQKVSVWVDLS